MRPHPEVGDKIYVRSHYSFTHGADDFEGGMCEVVKAELGRSAGETVWFVEVKEDPAVMHNWEELSKDQETLKEALGRVRGKRIPDLRPEFNEG